MSKDASLKTQLTCEICLLTYHTTLFENFNSFTLLQGLNANL